MIDAEYMVVGTVDTAGNTFTVLSRSYGGTNATHVTTSTIYIVGMARLEGADADYVGLTTLTNPYNYTSIYQKALKITGTEGVISEYGYEDVFNYQANKAIPELTRLLSLAVFNGVRAQGSKTTTRSFGGLLTYITTNTVDGSAGAITKALIDSLALKIRLTGGMPDLLVLHPARENELRTILDSSSFVRLDQENTAFGMEPITLVRTQYGSMRLVPTLWCPRHKAYMLDSRKVGLYSLRPFNWYPLAKTGDSRKAEVAGEFSLVVANDKAHGYITNLTTV